MADFFKVHWRRPRKLVPGQELNRFPATPAEYYSGYYPASGPANSFNVKFDIKRQPLPELNNYPAATSPALLPAFIEPARFRTSFRRKILTQEELNFYPVTQVPGDIYPATIEQPRFTVSFERSLINLAELNSYPATPPSIAPLTAFLEPQSFRTRFERQLVCITDYPEISLAVSTVLGGTYNAAAYFGASKTVTIILTDPVTDAVINLDSATCVESTNAPGVYIWDTSKLTTQPTGYTEYVWRMTDGSSFEGGTIHMFDSGDTTKLLEIWRRLGLDSANPLTNSEDGSLSVADIDINATQSGTDVIQTRAP